MTIIFINRYFAPDHSATSQILSDLAFELRRRGWSIAVITSRQLYDTPGKRLAARETMAGVEVYRVWTSRFGRINLAGRAIDYLTFYLSAACQLWRIARNRDIIVAKTDPPMLSVIAAPIAWARQAHLINWLQDIFPEVAQALGTGRKTWLVLAYRLMSVVRNWSLRQARANIAIGKRMAKYLEELGVSPGRIRVIPNWADGRLVTPRKDSTNALRLEWNLQHKFVVGYSGNLGRAHEVDTLIDAIARLEQDDQISALDLEPAAITGSPTALNIAWLFIGSGALHKPFEAKIASRGLKSTQFRPYQPRERLSESLSVPDVHLVSLRPELEGLIVPSKYYGVAAAGRPTIFIGDEDGEIARLLKAEQCGWTINARNGAALAELVQSLAANPQLVRDMGQRARAAFDRSSDLPIAVAAWNRLLEEISDAPANTLFAKTLTP
jgi:colanic acid biosynthesis glycosyl transferase WcaI